LNQEGLGHTELLQYFEGVFAAQSEQFNSLVKSINERRQVIDLQALVSLEMNCETVIAASEERFP